MSISYSPLSRMQPLLPLSRTRSTSAGATSAPPVLAALLAGTLALALAGPAAAGEVYRWETSEGGLAFTDDPDRVPPRHREAAEAVELEGLEGYARYTPQRHEAGPREAERLAERLERLRALSADAPSRSAPRAGSGTVVETGHGMRLRLPDPAPGSEEESEPVVVEEVRVREPGRSATKTDTVVRRGDRVYLVVSPLSTTRSRPGSVPSEAELLRSGKGETE